jgi:hypothetical protein
MIMRIIRPQGIAKANKEPGQNMTSTTSMDMAIWMELFCSITKKKKQSTYKSTCFIQKVILMIKSDWSTKRRVEEKFHIQKGKRPRQIEENFPCTKYHTKRIEEVPKEKGQTPNNQQMSVVELPEDKWQGSRKATSPTRVHRVIVELKKKKKWYQPKRIG